MAGTPSTQRDIAAASALTSAATLGGTWIVRQGLEGLYRRRTGHAPPKASDPGVSMLQALAWAVVTAAALAATQVVVQRAFRPRP